MSPDLAIIELLDSALRGVGRFKTRRMFGGHGLYLDGDFFAILDKGILYFRVSELTRPLFEAEGMGPFTYQTKSGEHALKSYWRVPDRLLDEEDELREWVRAAVNSARSVAASKPARTPNRRPTKKMR